MQLQNAAMYAGGLGLAMYTPGAFSWLIAAVFGVFEASSVSWTVVVLGWVGQSGWLLVVLPARVKGYWICGEDTSCTVEGGWFFLLGGLFLLEGGFCWC